MNTRPVIESSHAPLTLSASFNQDASCFAVGSETGFCVYNSDPCKLSLLRDFNAGVGAVEMLEKTNFVAIVGGGKQPKFAKNKVIIWNDSTRKVAIELAVVSSVRAVRFSKTHIVVVHLNSVRVYKFGMSPELTGEFPTADNPHGLCCLGTKHLAIPGITTGQVRVIEMATGNVSIVPAHGSPLRALDISRDGETLATASETGTLIRIFAIPSFAKLAELRRGVDHATIFSLAISPSGQLLAVTSDKSTLHVFDIPHPSKPPRSESAAGTSRSTAQTGGVSTTPKDVGPSQKWGVLGRIPLLPRVFSDTYSFASVHFEIGNEPSYGTAAGATSSSAFSSRPGPPKGIIGWTDDDTIIVIGAGRDSRWEKFKVAEDELERRWVYRDGWKRYHGAQ